MSDEDSDGVYTFTTLIPVGSYEYKVVLNNNWNQSTSAINKQFTSDGLSETRFSYNMKNNDSFVEAIPNQLSIPENITINIDNGVVSITWDEVNNATSYQILSSDEPEGSFIIDESGIFENNSWSKLEGSDKKFYKVKAISN